MATFRTLPSGKIQAQVWRAGVRRSASFKTKREARDWAARQEHLILDGGQRASRQTLAEVFDRYAREVSPAKRGARWEMIRLEKLARYSIGSARVCDLTAQDFADWRDRRLKEVAPGSVRREMQLLSSVMTVARREWGLIQINPLADVRKPSAPPARDRRVTDDEIDQLTVAAISSRERRAVVVFRFAVETGMRAGEICGLTWPDINGRVAHLSMTKNGTARDVPLSSGAMAILGELPEGGGSVFGMTPAQLDAMFRKVRDRAKIDGLCFHDSRHEAITRMAGKLDVLSLARVVGHRNINQLLTYYNESAADLAEKLG